MSTSTQSDPRRRALRILLDAIYAGASYSPEIILGALDEVDRDAGIRRVDADLLCQACYPGD